MTDQLELNARYLASGQPALELLALAPATTGLLLVDVYDGIQGDENIEGLTGQKLTLWRQTVGRLAGALSAARSAGLPVIYTMNSAPRIALEHSEFGRHCQRSWADDFNHAFREGGVDPREYHAGRPGPLTIDAALAPRPGEYYVRKHVYSAFFDTRLDTLLRNLEVRTLVMGGFWAGICMLATALDAFYRNYRVIWLRDGTLAGELPGQEAGLPKTNAAIQWFENAVGYTVMVDAFCAACSRLAQPS
jgi:ureidoacrylate peracid hydrolase